MKKVLLFALVIMVSLPLMAVNFGEGMKDQPASVKVAWKLASEDLTGSYQIGFFSDDAGNTAATEVALTSTAGANSLVGTGDVYLFWDFVTKSEAVTISLYSGALTGTVQTGEGTESRSETINWEAEITANTNNSAYSITRSKFSDKTSGLYGTSEDPVEIVKYTSGNTSMGSNGSVKLAITTANAVDKAPADYSATLTAVVKGI